MAIDNAKELGKALKEEKDFIEIEGDLKKTVLRIKATGKFAWAIAIAAISVAVVATIAAIPTGGLSETAGFIAAPAAIGVLGVDVTAAAISIAIAAGGIGALNSLRNYKIFENYGDTLVLERK